MTKRILATCGLFLVVLIPFGGWLLRYLNLDFWYDEVYTLKQYVFVPIETIPTNYPNPNNHILFNLINNLWVSVLHIPNMDALMAHPLAIRALMLVYTILTIAGLGLLTWRYFNRRVAVLALLVLVTSLPYINFTLQLRGYSLGMLLTVLVLCCLLAGANKLTWLNGTGLVVSTALLLYTVPSNLYLVASIILFLGFVWVGGIYFRLKIENGSRPGLISSLSLDSNVFRALLLLGAGCGLAGLFYLPVLGNVLSIAKTQGANLFSLKTRLLLFPRTLNDFVSFRYALLLLVPLGLTASVRLKHWGVLQHCLACLFALIVPFAMNFVLWSEPADRVFVILLVPFALLVALSLDELIGAVPRLDQRSDWALVALIVYCQITLVFAFQNRDTRLLWDIHHAQSSQNIFYNYYQAYYNPSQVVALYQSLDRVNGSPLYVYNYGDGVAIPAYLDRAEIKSFKVDSVSQIPLNSASPTYVLSAFPDLFLQMARRSYQNAECGLVNSEAGFINLFSCKLSSP